MQKRLKVGLFLGGRSTEHEVSVITALQTYENLDLTKYEVIPVFISKSGDFYSNANFLEIKNYRDIDSLLLSSSKVTLAKKDHQPGLISFGMFQKFIPLDITFPALHGSFGEDGSLQGLFEIIQIPYVGFNVLGSAIGMDKIAQKAIFKELGLNVGKYTWAHRVDFYKDQRGCLEEIKSAIKFPLYVKPANIGSTIGVNKASNEDELVFHMEVAAAYSEKILIEEAFEEVIEVNCAAAGYLYPEVSVCEMPIKSGDSLSYDDKYIKGNKGTKGSKGSGMASLSRKIPAPISDKLTKEIQQATRYIFKSLDGCGVARVDYFVDLKKEKFWVNEINTIPGSLSFYLFEPKGIKYRELLNKIIQAGFDRFEEQKKTQFTFNSDLLEQMAKKAKI